jgi:hypothetical protein
MPGRGVAERGLGRVVRHDSRSRLPQFHAERAPVRAVQWPIGPILDQGKRSGCTGWATAACLNCGPNNDALRDRGVPPLTDEDGLLIYSLATVKDGFVGTFPPMDEGSSGLGAAQAAKAFGLIRRYNHAFGLDHLLAALSLRPVMVGVPWLEGMNEPDRDGVVSVTGAQLGGHEFCLFGIDLERQHVLAQQSWGPDWGVNGTFRIPFAGMGLLLADDGDVTVPIS